MEDLGANHALPILYLRHPARAVLVVMPDVLSTTIT
jgi:hypothetical protein